MQDQLGVDQYMKPVSDAISKYVDDGAQFTEIYNRAWEAVNNALSKVQPNQIPQPGNPSNMHPSPNTNLQMDEIKNSNAQALLIKAFKKSNGIKIGSFLFGVKKISGKEITLKLIRFVF